MNMNAKIFRILSLMIVITSTGYCLSRNTSFEFSGEADTKKYMGYNYKIEKTSDDYCMDSVAPTEGIIGPGTGVRFHLEYKSGAFSYCGWRHSSQLFHIEKYDDPNISAKARWYKPAGKDPYIKVEYDPHHIVHPHSQWEVFIGYPR